MFVFEHNYLGPPFCVGVGAPSEVITVMVQRRCDVVSGSDFCSPCFAFVGMFQHLHFDAKWGQRMAVEIVLTVEYGPRADLQGDV